jgi:hypothetical protein
MPAKLPNQLPELNPDAVLSRPGMSGDFIRWKDEVHVTSAVLFARDP